MNYDRYPRPRVRFDYEGSTVAATAPFADTDPYYHIEYCFTRGEDQPTLRVDIEINHLGTWMDQMLRFGNVKIVSVQLIKE